MKVSTEYKNYLINKLNYKDPIPYDDYIHKITQSFIVKEIPKNTINYYDIYSIIFIIILITIIFTLY